MTHEIRLVNNFDGAELFGVYVNSHVIWTGSEESCKDYCLILDKRAAGQEVMGWRELRKQRGGSPRRYERYVDDGRPFEACTSD